MAARLNPPAKVSRCGFPAPPLTGADPAAAPPRCGGELQPAVYGARVNVEHHLSMLPDSNFGAMGMLLL